ncbi:protein-(glutamine-N5) methyltransferase, release factor-specific [Orenia metallireducens]|uniref:Release factor glutamine methyltransferase n=1 Tax=Orenia metallireducens TaxID=1413210 RepID=A0A1C0A6C5_9FIRM|nr:peptide chain release factor N(5)-glutamine methyltransferase [Orenia metallireducens]OCL25663.1 protein-(glutamine-N5) methyltransferase, release factor-specific [Orenia metallireducens]
MELLTVKEILDRTVKHFQKYEIASARLDAEILLSEILDMERINLYVNFDKPLTKSEIDKYRQFVIARSKGTPVAYILGSQEFMSLDFKVTDATLIPRPETEHLVEVTLDKIKSMDLDRIKVVDIGTGSGAIIVSLTKLATKKIEAIAVDISADALDVAQENARNHDLLDRIDFRLGSLLEPVSETVDIIVSNPPYIPTSDIDNLQREVKNEPMTALDGGKDGLDFYRGIINQSVSRLNTGGLIAFEVGINQANDVAVLLENNCFDNIEVIKDYAGIERVILATRK